MVKGAPVFLLDVDSQETHRFGFYTTRLVKAATVDDAGRAVTRLVLDEFATRGTKNPPDQPISVRVEEVTKVSWWEAVRGGPGRGFTFYPDDVS